MDGSQYIWILNGISLLLTSGALAGNLVQNVALNKKADQSSENVSGAAGRAVDGNRNSSFESGSCTLTNTESDPWWRVDLQNVYKITAVTITNRNYLESRLNGAEVWIGNSIKANDNQNARCAVIPHIPSGQTLYLPCKAEGRYVAVLLPGSQRVLSLCEVEVYPVSFAYPVPNVALRGVATQSSTLSFASADKAIDGRRNSFYSRGFCSHTAEDETNPWWRVDLLTGYTVISVKVTSRGDCCAERLDGAEIRIGYSLENNGNNNPRCASVSHIREGKTYTFRCDGGSMDGRFVNVLIPGERKTLTLCEVEVYGTPAVAPVPNVALKKQATQSTTDLHAYKAVSGCVSGTLSDGCCSRTSLESNPWWRVDLSAVHTVWAVTIINRQDCCSEMLVGVEIWIGNSRETYNENTRCGDVSQVQATPVHTFICGDITGRYVFVTIPGLFKTLTLCEVEVYGFQYEVAPSARLLLPRSLPPLPPTVSMQLSGRDVTVVGSRLCWSDALLFCRRHHWDLLGLHSQEEQSEMERLLGRSPFPLTDHVWLGLRRHKMLNSWFWMSGDPMNFTKWPLGSAAQPSSNLCGGVSGGERHLWEDQPCDELLNFICQSRAEDAGQRVYFYSTREALSTS